MYLKGQYTSAFIKPLDINNAELAQSHLSHQRRKKEKLGANGEESYGLIRWHLVWQAAVEATSIVYLGVTCLIHATQRLNSLTPWWCGVASATMVLRSWLSYQNTLVWIKIITWSSSVIIYPTQLNNAGLNSLWRMELLAILFLT